MSISTYCLTNTSLLLHIYILSLRSRFDVSSFPFINCLMYFTGGKFEDSPSFFDRNRARYLNISAYQLRGCTNNSPSSHCCFC